MTGADWNKLIFRHIMLTMVLVLTNLSVANAMALQPLDDSRFLSVDDIFELESQGGYYGGPYTFAGNGMLAFTRARPKRDLANHKLEYLWGNAGSDVWLHSSGEEPVNLTRGIEDGAGWWAPEWSPDGRYLAMLSTRRGNVHAWVWDVDARELRLLSDRGVDTGNFRVRPYTWIDGTRLLLPVLPEGEQPVGMRTELATPQIASREWPKVIAGRESTASVLDSGVAVDLASRVQGRLLLVDVDGATASTVVDGSTRSIQISPRRDAVAFVRAINKYLPQQGEPLPFGVSDRYGLGLAAIDGTPIEINGDISHDILADSLRWSPDGELLAFLGYPDAGHGVRPRLYVVNLDSRRSRSLSLDGLDAAPIVREQERLEWTGKGQLLVYAAQVEGDQRLAPTMRRDWWVVGVDSGVHNLTASMARAPAELWPEPSHGGFVGLADGDVWRIRPNGAVENLTADFEPSITRLQWPIRGSSGQEQWPRGSETYERLVFAAGDRRGASRHFVIDLNTGEIDPLHTPAERAELKAYDPASGSAVFLRNDHEGFYLWRGQAGTNESTPLVAANTFLRDIQPASAQRIEYMGLNGQRLQAWLLLPPDHRDGQLHPLLTWVYAGSMVRDTPPASANLASISGLNLQIPAAHGYAVLIPSMPLGPEGVPDDPMLRLGDGVLPAVDRVVEMGIADPERLYLMGQSFGGYSVYGLVTQTDRFAAAVSLAGLSNLISLYGQFDARRRYEDYPHENLFTMALNESAQARMGGPPWEELDRYLRNSPIFQVDKVNTPLMIIQGDLDYVAIQQGEEFFNGLYRQGKRVRFVRYWGEGHSLQSPANIRDMWQRVFEWFDEFPVTSYEDIPVVQ